MPIEYVPVLVLVVLVVSLFVDSIAIALRPWRMRRRVRHYLDGGATLAEAVALTERDFGW